MRQRYQMPPLATTQSLNRESAGDVLEAILGMEDLGHLAMDNDGKRIRQYIEAVATGVSHVWSLYHPNEWNLDTLSDAFLLMHDYEVETRPTKRHVQSQRLYEAHLTRVEQKTVMGFLVAPFLPKDLHNKVTAFLRKIE